MSIVNVKKKKSREKKIENAFFDAITFNKYH
jgi:hypothetical protein